MAPDRLPTPFSAEQIRDASAPGTRVAFRIEEAGRDPVMQWWETVAIGEHDGKRRRWTELADGTIVDGPVETTSTWLSLQAHASYPTAKTTLSRTTIELGIGARDCWVYRVSNDDGSETTAWFARDLPGPPVLMVTTSHGEVVFRMTLVEVIPPG